MKILPLSCTAVLTLLFGAALPASAQHDHHGGNKGRHESHHDDHGSQTRQPEHGHHDGPSGHDHHPDRPAQESRDWQEHRGWREHGGWGEHGSWHDHRSLHWAHDHRGWAQRGGYRGYYIPHDRFVLYFGPRHFFRIGRPVIYLGYPRFVYRDTSFIFVDPYPAEWGDSWYDSDDVYVDYTDGYYLHNRRHPGVSIAINIVN